MTVAIRHAVAEDDWAAIHRLLIRAFAFMEGRINPPSSLLRMGPNTLKDTGPSGACLLACAQGAIIGCVFCTPVEGALQIGKLAVDPDRQRHGIGRALLAAAEAEAHDRGLPEMTLQTRVELSENHAAFRAMGFVEAGRTSHPGFQRATSVTMRKALI